MERGGGFVTTAQYLCCAPPYVAYQPQPMCTRPHGRYLRAAANSSLASGSLVDNDYDQLRCVRPSLHPQWTPKNALNDIAVCFLDGESRFAPVALASGAAGGHACGQ
jgi:hypothetical protein